MSVRAAAAFDVVLAALAGLVLPLPDAQRTRAAGEACLLAALGAASPSRPRAASAVAAKRPAGARARAHAVQQALALGEILTPAHLRAPKWGS